MAPGPGVTRKPPRVHGIQFTMPRLSCGARSTTVQLCLATDRHKVVHHHRHRLSDAAWNTHKDASLGWVLPGVTLHMHGCGTSLVLWGSGWITLYRHVDLTMELPLASDACTKSSWAKSRVMK
eukprot:2348743-Amphidinium_carterae.1